jgi:hypothetical protein
MSAGVTISGGSGGGGPIMPGAGGDLFIFRPLEPAPAGNVFASWAALVTAAAAIVGPKRVYFDNTLGPCVIPAGVWTFGSYTKFFGPSESSSSTPIRLTPIAIADGAKLIDVFEFEALAIDSQTSTFVLDAPAATPGAVLYVVRENATVVQSNAAGVFARANQPGGTLVFALIGGAQTITGAGPVVKATAIGASLIVAASQGQAIVNQDTIAAIVGAGVGAALVDPACIVNPLQAGVPGGILQTNLVSEAARVHYDDTLVAPLLTAADVQAAIDALKTRTLAGFPNGVAIYDGTGSTLTSSANLTYTAGKLTVVGIIDPTALELSDPLLGTDLYFQSADGQTAAVAPLTKGRLRYNQVTTRWEESHNASAWAPLSTPAFPVLDSVFLVENAIDPTKQLAADLSGQAAATTTTITTTAQVSRPFRLPDISGTAIVQQDATGQVFIGIGVTTTLHGSNAGLQYSSTTANRAQFRGNQYGANTAGAGVTTFKSRGAAIGALGAVLPGDLLGRWTAIGVAADGASLQLAATISLQVPAAYVPVGTDSWVPTDYELALVALAGPANSRRNVQVVTSEGETRTLRGSRAGGPSTLPAALGAGALRSSDAVAPNGTIVGSPGDLYTDTTTGQLWAKQTGVNTNTGWIALGPIQLYKFSGQAPFAGLPFPFFFADDGQGAPSPFGLRYPIMLDASTFEYRIFIQISTTTLPATFNLLSNGLPIDGAGTIIPAAATGAFAFPVTAAALVAGIDHLDFQLTFTAGDNGATIVAAAMAMLR